MGKAEASPKEKKAKRPPKKPFSKATNAEIERRVGIVADLLLAGFNPREIVQYLSAKENIDVGLRQVENYIQRATEEITKRAEESKDVQFAQSVARLEHLYRRSLGIHDFKACLQVQKEINALFGLHAPVKSAHEIGGALEVEVVHRIVE